MEPDSLAQRIALRLPRSLVRLVERIMLFTLLPLRDWCAGRQLTAVRDLTARLQKGDIVLATCLRNEAARLPAFADHYRRLGVSHFLVVDNGSTDGLMDWAMAQEDVSVWRTEASYKQAAFGMLWINDLLRRFARGHWCVVCDPDEFLVYPHVETRDLRALTGFLEEDKRRVMHAVLLDAYSADPPSQTLLELGVDPFEVCPFFDREGYIQTTGWGGTTWIRGGPRLRVHFDGRDLFEAPALNKIPLVKWRWWYHYRNSTHDARPRSLNLAHAPGKMSVTGAMFHFKFVSTLLEKAEEESERGQHWAGGIQYAQYGQHADSVLYSEEISARYVDSQQLVDLGLMSPGAWF